MKAARTATERPAVALSWEQVRAWRLRRHRLHERVGRAAMLEVVARLCGLHAQLLSSAELSLWARVEGLDPEAVQRALWEERRLVKAGGALLKPAAFLGHLCFAPKRGQNVRFTRPNNWLRGWRQEDPGDALVQITRRFLAAYGPATRDDYGRWWAPARPEPGP